METNFNEVFEQMTEEQKMKFAEIGFKEFIRWRVNLEKMFKLPPGEESEKFSQLIQKVLEKRNSKV